MNYLKDKKILLIITGGIAAYKSLELIRLLKSKGSEIKTVLTKSGKEFVTPLSITSLTQNKVYEELFDSNSEAEMDHITLSRWCDVILVAPATANSISKFSYGNAEDLASTLVLASDKKVILVPAMNVRMWMHQATQENISKLLNYGYLCVGPEIGEMACGEYGEGKMSEPTKIIEFLNNFFSGQKTISKKKLKAIVTSGPTKEYIDPIRYISNNSSGKQGYEIAKSLIKNGIETTLISGPTNLPDPKNLKLIKVQTGEEMYEETKKNLPVDIAVCAAAVGDFKISKFQKNKIKKQDKINLELEKDIYESWIKKLKLVEEFQHYLVFSSPTRFIRDWVVSRYIDKILEIVKLHKKTVSRIDFIIESELSANINNVLDQNLKIVKETQTSNVSFIKDSLINYTRLDPNKSFENFIIGESNNLAYQASQKVCEQIAHYNPLFIYGGIGMGKTHLLNAIGLKMRENNKVMFISAERFMYHFIKSIRNKEMVKFKDSFRASDLFIIDDIQFVIGKEVMQEEFFHTFNALIDKGSQIVISSDRAPTKLTKIQERIKSRFSGGLVVDIQQSDFDLRLSILKSKINEIKKTFSDIIEPDNNLLNFIASEMKINIRETIGALNRIISFSRIYNKSPSISESKIILKDLINFSENHVSIETIKKTVCDYFKININEMLSQRRSRYLVRPRQIAMYLTKNLTSKSLPDIGREFSGRDHTTVIHSVKTINKLKGRDDEMCKTIENLKISYYIKITMKFSVSRDQLLKSLNYCQGVIEKRSTLPILSNVLIEAKNSSVKITVTDLDLIFTNLSNNIKIEAEGSTTTSASIIYDIVRKLTSGSEINFNLVNENKLQLESEKSKFNLLCLSPNDFPLVDENFNDNEFTIDSKLLLKLLNKSRFSISNDETRHYLNGVFLHQTEYEKNYFLTAAATDGHRMSISKTKLNSKINFESIILPKKTIYQLVPLLEDQEATIKICNIKSKIKFEFNNSILISKLIDGKFPNYIQVIPTNNKKKLEINVNNFLNSVDRVASVSTDRKEGVKFQLLKNILKLSVNNPNSGDGSETLEVKFDHELNISFNSKYLIDVASQINGEKIIFYLNETGSPALIKDPVDKDSIFVIMPMKA